MARPKKQTVDYFPHQCKHGKTIYILKEKYKHVGYAFWFILLEELGSAEGHFIDCRKPTAMRFLQATTMTSEDLCNEILDLLAEIEAIDPDLWNKERVVWSDNFVSGISSVYANRRVEMPSKPSFYKQKPQSAQVSTNEKPQSKVKESIVDQSIVEEAEVPLSKKDTPAQKMKIFLTSVKEKDDRYESLIEILEKKGVDRGTAETEVKAFAAYWSELSKDGKRQKWQLRETFEVNKRLATWFARIGKWQKQTKEEVDVGSVMF